MQPKSLFSPEARAGWLRVCAHYAINYSVYDMPMHTHSAWELMYVASGRCEVLLPEQRYSLKEGDCIFVDCMVPHRLIVPRGVACRVLNLEIALAPTGGTSTLGALLEQPGECLRGWFDAKPKVQLVQDIGPLHGIIRAVQAQQEDPSPESVFITDLQLSALLVELARHATRQAGDVSAATVHVRKALRYLEKNYDAELTVEDIARAVGISRAHLQRLFAAETGMPLLEYIHKKRIQKACMLLENSSLSVVDIAVSVGFRTRQHFTEVFSRTTGYSPGRYRRLHQEKV